jgi:LPXTG-motif cell wall-anchored protein
MDKRVSHIKITLPNGQVLEDTDVNEDGTFKNGNTALGPFINTTQGTIWAEMDNELIQGSKLDVTYSITAKNTSERDFMNQNYYWYGESSKDETNPVTIIATGINDYLDKEFAYDEVANSDWTIVREDENTSKEQIINTIPGTDWEKVEEYTKEDGTKVAKYKKNNAGTEKTTETSWKYVVQSSRQSGIDDETILKLKTEAVSKFANIKAGEKATVELNVSKVLANVDEIELGNKAEITQINVSNGREPILSKTFDDAEMVTVTPNTGENRNHIMPIILGTSLLVILGAGVVLIKKKVLNK